MYNATLFINTGFNAINIPDNPSLLAQAQAVTVPALDIYQVRELSSFVVKATYASIKNADYLYLSNPNDAADFAYYSIQNITMTSMDTAVLSVTMDYILTAGGSTGVSSLSFTDGICERHHVPLADDIFGKYGEEDPYMAPSEMMELDVAKVGFGVTNALTTLLEATVDLGATETYASAYHKLKGFDFTTDDSLGTGKNCVVPFIESLPISTRICMENGGQSDWYSCLPNAVLYKAGSYNGNPTSAPTVESWIPEALKYARSLALESSILAQYVIPADMVTVSETSSGGHPYTSLLTGKRKTETLGVNLNFVKSYSGLTVRNQRLFYGDNVKYTIVSVASGNSASFLPEEIYASGASAPTVEMRVDPRPKGCPYFRFNTYRGSSDAELFFTNAVKGLEWQNAPLVYEGASGSLLNQYKFNARMIAGYEDVNYAYKSSELQNQQGNLNATAGTVGSLLSAVGYGVSPSGGLGSMLGSVADAATNEVNRNFMNAQYNLSRSHQENSWNIARNSELGALLIQNNCVAPSMNFPISEAIRDYVGNTCLVYRTCYTDTDAARIDKILTMYGYKHTVPIENSFLTNRSKFNFIQARGVSINNLNIPKWLRDGVAAQFAAGMRIWHVLPDPAIYTNGTNI